MSLNQARIYKFKAFDLFYEVNNLLQDIRNEMISGGVKIEDNVEDESIWVDLGRVFSSRNTDYYVSSYVYEQMLQTIEELNSKGRNLHRGLALYNLGISQINLGGYDEGISNVLDAYEEDIKHFGATSTVTLPASILKQNILDFTEKQLMTYFSSLITFVQSGTLKTIALKQLLSHLKEDEQLFTSKIMLSKSNFTYGRNTYTRIIMFDNLKNILLLVEVVLKKKLNAKTLGDLIDKIFTGASWKGIYDINKNLTWFNNSSASNADHIGPKLTLLRINKINKPLSASAEDYYLAKIFLTAHLIRNYTSHLFDEYPDILNNRTIYQYVFTSAVHVLLYSLFKVHIP